MTVVLPPPVPQLDVVHDGVWMARVDLVAAGWTVIRLSAADLRSMDDVVRRIAKALAAVPRLS
ncbi:MAG: endonuclease domain-containing protein [Actinomycetota bacterium]|nr:endonuclease domain-containing protein [Actinomycetota bacterium]